jgi:hypothetical protein
MAGINMARVLIGGLVAGLVINIGEFVLNMFVIQAEMEAAVARMNLPPVAGEQIGMYVALAFLLGIATVWLYAAIRPRFGAGVSTALCAGSAVWFFAYLYPGLGMWVMGMFPTGTMSSLGASRGISRRGRARSVRNGITRTCAHRPLASSRRERSSWRLRSRADLPAIALCARQR